MRRLDVESADRPCSTGSDSSTSGATRRSMRAFGPGPHLVWGPNAAGKTSLLEAMVLLAWGRSHRTSADGELIRWGTDLARVEGVVGSDAVEVALVRAGANGPAGRKRIRVNGVGRRAAGLAGLLRVVVFAPEEMLLIAGSPSLRRAALDQLADGRLAGVRRRAGDVRADAPAAQQPAPRDPRGRRVTRRAALLGRAVPRCRARPSSTERRRLLAALAEPLAAAHAEIAPDEAAAERLTLRYETNAPPLPGESPRDALARRLAETADKEVWNGSTLVGPHRDDLVFELAGRDLATFASRGQQRTAILAFKLAELDLLTALDGRPPLLLLDDVFSRARPGPSVAPRPAHRRAAPGVRDDDDPRRPRPGPARDRDAPGRSGSTADGARGRRARAPAAARPTEAPA